MKEAVKKARERAYLERFREILADFPEGEVISFEHPDFLVKTQSRWIGIELTEYHVQEPDESWGSPMRARKGAEDKVLRKASAQYQSRDLPAVAVHIHWNSHQVFSSRRVQELAADLADLVQEHLPEQGHEAAIRRRRHPARRSLPQEVTSLSIDRRNNPQRTHGRPCAGRSCLLSLPRTTTDNANQRSQGALLPAAVPRSVAPYSCPWLRTVHACRPRAGGRRSPV